MLDPGRGRTHKVLALALALAVCLSVPGCLTKWVYDKYDHAPIESAWIRVERASPDTIRMRIGTRYRGVVDKKTKVRLDPELDSCESVKVRTRTTEGVRVLEPGVRYDLSLRTVLDSGDGAYPDLGGVPGEDCTVSILFSTYAEDLSLAAENIEGRLARATIDSPPNVVMLAVAMPATVVADLTALSLVIVAICVADAECGRELLESLETSPSEDPCDDPITCR